MTDTQTTTAEQEKPVVPNFPKLKPKSTERQYRSIRVPPNRYKPLQREWEKIYTPIVEQMNLQIRMNPKKRIVELRTSKHTTDVNALQKAADFVNAYLLGFDVNVECCIIEEIVYHFNRIVWRYCDWMIFMWRVLKFKMVFERVYKLIVVSEKIGR